MILPLFKRRVSHYHHLVLLLGSMLLLGQCRNITGNGLKEINVSIAGQPLVVEVATTARDRNRGLMFRTHLAPDHGMLFVWPRAEYRNFWMKNTLIPLDIGFFDDQNFLINIEQMEPDDHSGSYPDYKSAEPARYAIETNQGWFAEHGIKKFDLLKLPYAISAED